MRAITPKKTANGEDPGSLGYVEGAGRIVSFAEPGVSFGDCVKAVKKGLWLDHGMFFFSIHL